MTTNQSRWRAVPHEPTREMWQTFHLAEPVNKVRALLTAAPAYPGPDAETVRGWFEADMALNEQNITPDALYPNQYDDDGTQWAWVSYKRGIARLVAHLNEKQPLDTSNNILDTLGINQEERAL